MLSWQISAYYTPTISIDIRTRYFSVQVKLILKSSCNHKLWAFRYLKFPCRLTPFHDYRLLGTPTEKEWPGVSSLRDWHVYPQWEPQNLARAVPSLGPDGVDLLLVSPSSHILCLFDFLVTWNDWFKISVYVLLLATLVKMMTTT